jgi:hypothetical protein
MTVASAIDIKLRPPKQPQLTGNGEKEANNPDTEPAIAFSLPS